MRADYVKSARSNLANWRPPHIVDVDDAIVERLVSGDRSVAPNWYELHAAIMRLSVDRQSSRFVAEQLGITRETVLRHRQRVIV